MNTNGIFIAQKTMNIIGFEKKSVSFFKLFFYSVTDMSDFTASNVKYLEIIMTVIIIVILLGESKKHF